MKTILTITGLLAVFVFAGACQKKAAAPEPIRIVHKDIVQNGDIYEVRGSVHNPRPTGAEAVKVAFRVFENEYVGGDFKKVDHGARSETIDFLPAKESVDFVVRFHLRIAKELNVVTTDAGTITEAGR